MFVKCIVFGALDGKEVPLMLCLHADVHTYLAAFFSRIYTRRCSQYHSSMFHRGPSVPFRIQKPFAVMKKKPSAQQCAEYHVEATSRLASVDIETLRQKLKRERGKALGNLPNTLNFECDYTTHANVCTLFRIFSSYNTMDGPRRCCTPDSPSLACQ